MKTKAILSILITLVFFVSCNNNEVLEPATYDCIYTYPDASDSHPNAQRYQEILDSNRKQGLIGATLLIKDNYGVWIGSSGKSDIASNAELQPCNRFLIASISKVFTASAIFRYVDAGVLSINDPISDWLDPEIIEKLNNAQDAKISHLLSHTSGIADYYTMQFQLDVLNAVYNGLSQRELVEYAYGKKATNAVGETYYYSNTNFVLLGLILEKASGLSLDDVYEQEIFTPLNLTSAYFSLTDPIPSDAVKGYADIYGNRQFVDGEFLYKDELGAGDGGIVINAFDLNTFFESLAKGQLISEESFAQMTNWFDLPEDWVNPHFGHYQNGYGIMHNKTDYSNSIGHTGALWGFSTIVQYFPDEDYTYMLLVNSASFDEESQLDIFNESLEIMFE